MSVSSTAPVAIPVVSPATVDLDRHAVIEASAGTGKTHLIEGLVEEFVCRRHIGIQRLLMVTYTEKAAGELRERIRRRLEAAAAAGNRHAATALRDFPQAAITTIHGFCQGVIREFALDCGLPFRTELGDEESLVVKCLNRVKRMQWREWAASCGPAARLADALALVAFNKNFDFGMIRAIKAHRQGRDILRPKGTVSFRTVIRHLARRIRGLPKTLAPIPFTELPSRYAALPIKGNFKPSPRIAFLEEVVAAVAATDDLACTARFADALRRATTASTLEGWLAGAFVRRAATTAGWEAELQRLVAAMQGLKDSCDLMAAHWRSMTLVSVKREMEEAKARQGIILFDDMIERLRLALDREPDGELFHALRTRFLVALVDEFQDTDTAQWEIFRRIFVDPPEKRRVILVIGDPKQAIYRFRGADIGAYQAACKELLIRRGGKLYELETSYRQWPGLLKDLNGIFSHEEWFHAANGKADKIVYSTVKAAPDAHRRAWIVSFEDPPALADPLSVPPTGAFPVVRLVPLVAKGRAAGREMAGRIGELIEQLLTARNPLMIAERSAAAGLVPRPLGAGDIAVLVRDRVDAEVIEKALAGRHIAFSRYKKSGIFESPESAHVEFLLESLGHLRDDESLRRALLTPFGGWALCDLDAFDHVPEETRAWFENLADLARERKWARLFRTLLSAPPPAGPSGSLEPLLLREAARPGGDRLLSNFRQIFELLEIDAEKMCLDLAGLVRRLRELRREAGDESGLYRIESDEPRVRIMTMHAAKGLEFPIVFVSGGFTSGDKRTAIFSRYHRRGRFTTDLARPKNQLEQDEEAAENLRIFYVALTRAMHLLFVPDAPADRTASAGPMSGFVAAALKHLAPPESSCHAPDAAPAMVAPSAASAPTPLARRGPAPAPVISGRWPVLASFSSLRGRALAEAAVRLAGSDSDPRAIDDEPEEDSMTALAGGFLHGRAAGSALHRLFERLGPGPFLEARDEAGTPGAGEIRKAVRLELSLFGLLPDDLADEEKAIDEAIQLLRRGWLVPVLPGGGRLLDSADGDFRHEVGFLLDAGIAEAPRPLARLLNGAMDLVVRRDGRYFAVDWKSNRLGNYDQAALDAAMKESGYDLQAGIYALALWRWLARRLPDFDFKRHFGGVIFLFLRGLDPARPGDGVRHVAYPDEESLEEFNRDLLSLLDPRRVAS